MPIRGFKNEGIVACFDRTPGVPSPSFDQTFDINHPENAPAKSPASHLAKLIWHSALFQYEIAAGPVDVTVNHEALAGLTTTWTLPPGGSWGGDAGGTGSISYNVAGQTRERNIVLLNHGLGYVPKFMVSLSGRRVPDGYIVQLVGGNYRRASMWADATNIYLREAAASGAAGNDLPAVSLTYRVMVFRTRAPDPAKALWSGSGSGMQLARGIIDTARKYLRRTGAGDSPFAMNLGRTMDVQNGGTRTASGGVIVSEPRYGGSMPAPPYISVGVD